VTNALAQETSPYLRQHAENPVEWLPWGPEALTAARELDRPLLVSIGYSACHWCHVMERESFEDPAVAALMNTNFVCVKVDREERPDVDALYMEAVQSMSGHGGWPLNVFLTPEQLPFYGGTYFPPTPRHGMPSWTEVLQGVAESWREQPAEIRAGGERLREHLGAGARLSPSSEPLDAAALGQAVANLSESYDVRNGGFGGAPKFPPSSTLELLLARAGAQAESPEAQMALTTLRAIAAGGIHDQIGGGIHRYAVDATWTVPHFEKMLYDNALLARAFLHGWQLSGDLVLRRTCEEICDWALREMRAPEGGFYAALDADSEGVEGKFYVWSVAELSAELDAQDAAAAIAWLGAREQGNFAGEEGLAAGANVLRAHWPIAEQCEPPEPQRARIRAGLLAARERRVRPGLDDKRLTSWNALMIAALAECGAALGVDSYLQAAERCAEFILRDLRDERGRLLRTYGGGGSQRASLDGYLEDHAFLLEALLVLFEASCDERWFNAAVGLARELIDRFADPERGGFFSTAADAEALAVRRKDLEDAPIPAGSSSAAMGLLRLAELTGEAEYERHALSVLALVRDIAPRHPGAFAHVLQALHWHTSPMRPLACPVPVLRQSHETSP
jgi:uncharacterized protein YyaL (SSP411 family)